MGSTTRKTLTLIVDEINGNPDDGEVLNLPSLEVGFLRMIREHRASCGMCQLFVVSCEEELN